jgi:hypothetical protein
MRLVCWRTGSEVGFLSEFFRVSFAANHSVVAPHPCYCPCIVRWPWPVSYPVRSVLKLAGSSVTQHLAGFAVKGLYFALSLICVVKQTKSLDIKRALRAQNRLNECVIRNLCLPVSLLMCLIYSTVKCSFGWNIVLWIHTKKYRNIYCTTVLCHCFIMATKKLLKI